MLIQNTLIVKSLCHSMLFGLLKYMFINFFVIIKKMFLTKLLFYYTFLLIVNKIVSDELHQQPSCLQFVAVHLRYDRLQNCPKQCTKRKKSNDKNLIVYI